MKLNAFEQTQIFDCSRFFAGSGLGLAIAMAVRQHPQSGIARTHHKNLTV